MDFLKFLAYADQALKETHEKLEDSIELYGQCAEQYADDFIAYRKEKSRLTKDYRDKGEKATNIKAMVDGDSAEFKHKLLLSEYQKKKVEMLINAYELRIQTIKFMGKKIDPDRQ